MDFIIERVSNGGPFNANALYKEWKKENEKYLHVNSNSAGNWISLGPTNTPIILSNGKKKRKREGELYCIRSI